MENTSYGINVANRYDLFSIDDEGDDLYQAIVQTKPKASKKQQSQATTEITSSKAVSKNAEKENKTVSQNKSSNNENRHPDSKTVSGTNNNLHNQRGAGSEKHGIKETQKDNIRTTREDGNKNGYPNKNASEKRQINRSNFPVAGAVENREEKNNRKNLNNDENNTQRRSGGGNKRFEARGKREFDRQSGSNKTGVKAVEKRDGTGSHNWGSAKADAKEYNNFQEEYASHENEEDKGHISDQGNNKDEQTTEPVDSNKLPIEDELKEMTLDEWKAQTAASRSKPQYNLRKAGEGEDATQWDKMVALDKKKTEAGETEEENETQKIGKQRQVLEIEFHFNDGRRGGMMGRSRGRGGKGGGARPIGGKREGEKKDTYETREVDAGAAEKRDRRNNRPPLQSNEANFGGSYKFSKQSSRFKNTAPKVDDEHDFPSLG